MERLSTVQLFDTGDQIQYTNYWTRQKQIGTVINIEDFFARNKSYEMYHIQWSDSTYEWLSETDPISLAN